MPTFMQNVANMCHPVLVIPINYKKTQTGYINSLVTKKKCLITGYIYKSSSLCYILSAKVIIIKSIYVMLQIRFPSVVVFIFLNMS